MKPKQIAAMAGAGLVVGTAVAGLVNAQRSATATAAAEQAKVEADAARAIDGLRAARQAEPPKVASALEALATFKPRARSTGEPDPGFAQFVAWAARSMNE